MIQQTCQSRSLHPETIPDLIPVRMLNEFTYCPRLGYLEWVEGEWAENLETMQGTFGHRRVDRPDRQSIAAPTSAASADAVESAVDAESEDSAEPETIHARSLMLSAPAEGLLAKLDLLEIDGLTATPVDYKRGQAPKIPEGAWEPERVQLCAQGLILRENGFTCTHGVLYYIGSKKRVTIEFTSELIERTRQLRDEFRAAAAAGVIPPPLEDSPKCPRCSLVGICLPDEVQLLQRQAAEHLEDADLADDAPPEDGAARRAGGSPAAPRIRRLIPAADDALPLYIQSQGAMLGKSGDRLTVKQKDELLAERRLMDISQVSLFGNVMMSAQVLRELTVRGIPVCHFTYGGWFHGMTSGLVHNNVQLRIDQFAAAANPQRALEIARWLIAGKIRNARTMLRRHMADSSAETSEDAGVESEYLEAPVSSEPIEVGESVSIPGRSPELSSRQRILNALQEYRRRALRCDSAESLLGLEGMAAKTYFEGFFELLRGRHEFDVTGRNRRPPRDPVNAVLSFVYSLLVKELTIVLQAVGFDPLLGVFHRPRFARPGLALDCAEEYRPLLADSTVLMVFNNGEVDGGSFLERAGAVVLTEAGRRSVIAAWERRLSQEVTHPLFGYRISYRRVLEVQARLLARVITGELPEYIPFCTR
jgi:CRISPR-associated protein Cas1